MEEGWDVEDVEDEPLFSKEIQGKKVLWYLAQKAKMRDKYKEQGRITPIEALAEQLNDWGNDEAIAAYLSRLESEKKASMVKHMVVPMRLCGPVDGVKAKIKAEVADNPEKRATGLSGREKIASDGGMFFDTPGPFWMKDTKIPLDICFLTKEGAIIDQKSMQPQTDVDDSALKLYKSSDDKAVYAVEVPGGWLKRNKVNIGDYFEVEDA